MNDLMTMDKQFTGEQFMLDIVNTKGGNLPKKIEDVILVFEFTDFRAKAWRIMSDKMQKLEEHSEAHNSALRSGQKWGIAALYAQKRMGDITRELKTEYPDHLPDQKKKDYPTHKREKSGVKYHTYNDSELLSKNPETLDRVIKNAEERGEIPTKTAVLNTIRVEKHREREAEKTIKRNDKSENQRSKSVSDYYEAIKEFKAEIDHAVIAAERGKFDPAGKNFMIINHINIRAAMTQLEDLI